MYKEAADQINEGLSLGARIVLGLASLLLALLVLAIDTPPGKALFVYAFSGFSFAIAVACVVKGRLRRFMGSIIGLGLFVISVLYVASELQQGKIISGSRSEPSVMNALLFMFFFGFPGIAYVFKAKFGYKKP